MTLASACRHFTPASPEAGEAGAGDGEGYHYLFEQIFAGGMGLFVDPFAKKLYTMIAFLSINLITKWI